MLVRAGALTPLTAAASSVAASARNGKLLSPPGIRALGNFAATALTGAASSSAAIMGCRRWAAEAGHLGGCASWPWILQLLLLDTAGCSCGCLLLALPLQQPECLVVAQVIQTPLLDDWVPCPNPGVLLPALQLVLPLVVPAVADGGLSSFFRAGIARKLESLARVCVCLFHLPLRSLPQWAHCRWLCSPGL